ncbi:MAG TPA: ABC transporter ATP-binding protein, partial [Solirubrobacterales bacterium]|nr:ABC transporter ATP-binding protein [Solirubrobacterales bacterium]
MAIRVHGLRRSFGDVEAVAGVDLEVDHGEIFAFLGPNGAGKTTTIEILEGFGERDAGEVEVLGVDPAHATSDWRQRVGIVMQESPGEQELTVRECMELYAGLYKEPRPVDDTLELVGLDAEAAAKMTGTLSGGQRR